MSQIFDALHQSVSDRPDNGAREFSAAKELLQVVERKSVTPPVVASAPAAPVVREAGQPYASVTPVFSTENRLVCFSHNEGLAAEKFRFLATRLRHMQQKRALKRMVITSSVSGEGKSVVAANLACALAAGKQQVLLVEGDLRRPVLGQQLGLQELPGLSQALRTSADVFNSILRLEPSGLHVLLAGDAHMNPMEFVDATKLAALMDRVSNRFDWVIVDSPPVLPLADTSMWMRVTDAVLLVTRPGITSKRQLQRTYEALEQSKLLGTVLNASTETASNHYYHYYSRGGGLQVSASNPK